MPAQSYRLGESPRIVQPVGVPDFASTEAQVTVIKVPDGYFLRLIGLDVHYSINTAVETERLVFLQIVDPSGNTLIAADASAALNTAGFTPPDVIDVSFGVGFFGAELSAGDNNTFAFFSFGILDIFLPPAYTYRLQQSGFDPGDKVTATSGLVELIEAEDTSSDIPPGFGNKSTLANLLNTP